MYAVSYSVRGSGKFACRASMPCDSKRDKWSKDAGRFYQHAASRATDAAVRKLLGDLAAAESQHERTAGEIEEKRLPDAAKGKETTTPSGASSFR